MLRQRQRSGNERNGRRRGNNRAAGKADGAGNGFGLQELKTRKVLAQRAHEPGIPRAAPGQEDGGLAQMEPGGNCPDVGGQQLRAFPEQRGIGAGQERREPGNLFLAGLAHPVNQLIRRVEAELAQALLQRAGGLAGQIEIANLQLQVAQRQPVRAGVIAEQVPPATGAGGFTGGVATEDDAAGAGDGEDTGLLTECGGMTRHKIVADEEPGARPD